MTREPNDVRTTVAPKGLGINAAGAGVLSCAYLIKIEPKNYRVTGWTIWLAFTGPNKPQQHLDRQPRPVGGRLGLPGGPLGLGIGADEEPSQQRGAGRSVRRRFQLRYAAGSLLLGDSRGGSDRNGLREQQLGCRDRHRR